MKSQTTSVNPISISTAVIPALQVIAFALATALAAQVRIPLPFTPVPITLQTLVVLLGGALLGWKKGGIGQGLYVVWGVVGAPLFAGGAFGLAVLAGPTGGYLVGFVAAAILAGYLAPKARNYLELWGHLFVASLVILALGMLHLSLFLDGGFATSFKAGVLPFLIGDVLKTSAAAGIVFALRNRK